MVEMTRLVGRFLIYRRPPAMDRHPRVDLRDFAESRVYARERDKDRHPEKTRATILRCCVNGSHPPPTRHPREARFLLSQKDVAQAPLYELSQGTDYIILERFEI